MKKVCEAVQEMCEQRYQERQKEREGKIDDVEPECQWEVSRESVKTGCESLTCR